MSSIYGLPVDSASLMTNASNPVTRSGYRSVPAAINHWNPLQTGLLELFYYWDA